MARRIIWASILGAVVLFLMLQSFWWVAGVVLVAHILAKYEFRSLQPGLSRLAVTSYVVLGSLAWLVLSLSLVRHPCLATVTAIVAMVATACAATAVLQFERGAAFRPAQSLRFIISLLLITLPCSLVLAMMAKPGGFFYFILLLGASWGADTGAIFAGKLTGRTPLAPRLSPKKTVEGVIGGMLSAGACWAVAGMIFHFEGTFPGQLPPGWQALGPVLLLVVGAAVSLCGTFGDLAFSMFKRTAGIKDYGTLIPGHGGILDRIDSLLFVVPLVYILSLC